MQTQTVSGYRISQQQRQLWALHQASELQANAPYAASCVVQLDGAIEPLNVKSAIEAVVVRYEIFRTTFYRPPGIKVPFQVIHDTPLYAWQLADLSDQTGEPQSNAEAYFQAEAEGPFTLEDGPLFRATLVMVAEERAYLHLTLPSLCADSDTLQNLVSELAQHYVASQLPDEDELLQYADYAEWQAELLEADREDGTEGADEIEEARAYWTKNKPANLIDLSIPSEQSNRAATTWNISTTTTRIEPTVAAKISEIASTQSVDPAAVYLACWQSLLWRLTCAEEFQLRYVEKGRSDEDLLGAMGPFAKWLPLDVQLDSNLSIGEIGWQLHQIMQANAEWQEHFQWDEKDLASGVTPISFAYAQWPEEHRYGNVRWTMVRQQHLFNRFKLQLDCTQIGDELVVALHYDIALFGRADIERLLGQYVTFINSVAATPEQPVQGLDILTAEERKTLLVDWNQTEAAYPDQQCIHHLFEARAALVPDRLAVVCDGRMLTFSELNERANQLAHYLRNRGVKQGSRYVALCVDRSLEMVVGLLGILKAGGAYVPLNPENPAAWLRHQLAEIETPVLLTQSEYVDQLPEFAGEIIALNAETPVYAGEAQSNPNIDVSPDSPVYVIYTSGSTGMPKGVVLSHSNLINYSHFICQLLETDAADDTQGNGYQFAMVSTITADLGNTCLFPSLISGGTLHVLPYDVATDGGRFASYVSNHAIDVLKIVPSHLSALMAAQPSGINILPRKYLLLGGEAFTWTLYNQLVEQVTNQLVDQPSDRQDALKIFNHYGPTETTVGSLTNLVDVTNLDPSHVNSYSAGMVPIGRPIANTQLLILDEEQRPTPIGVAGELYIGGAGVAQGYLNQPELTREKFIRFAELGIREKGLTSTINLQQRFYRTGDFARYLPNGQVEFLGRGDNQVKIRGFRIELEEIESILGKHPDIRQVVLLVHDDEGAAGQSDRKRLVAYLILESDASATTTDLAAYLREELPDYMVPSAFVLLNALPLTPNGKVDRHKLPSPEKAGSSQKFVAPSTPIEETLAEIWATVLGLEKVGIHDNFFADLGGDSILSIQIIARANAAGLSLTPKQIFEYQTIAELASVAGTTELIQAEQGLVTGVVPLTPIQHWFFEQNFAEPHHWNQAIMLQVKQAVDSSLLEQVVQAIVVHHDALRMRFSPQTGGWTQVNADDENIGYFTHIDLFEGPADKVSSTIERQAAEIQASLHLGDGPLIRFVLFDLGDTGPARLLIASHHLVIDGVSWRHLLEDLQLGYQQVTQGKAIQFAPKTTSFKEWAEKLTEYAQSIELIDEAQYWLTESRRAVQPLPVDHPNEDNAVAASQTISVSCSEEETQAILHELPETYNTQINDVLLTALAQAAAKWTESRTLLVDLEGHGREDMISGVDVSRTVGWFTTHMPVLLNLDSANNQANGSEANLGAELLAIKEQLRAIPNNGIGYGLLRYLCQEETVASQFHNLPEPEIAFNYLGQLDQALSKESPFGIASESSGSAHSPRGHRSYPIYVSGSIANGRLQLAYMFSENRYRRETIEKLANGMIEALRRLIEQSQATDDVHFTPSDFTLAGLDSQELDAIAGMLEELGE